MPSSKEPAHDERGSRAYPSDGARSGAATKSTEHEAASASAEFSTSDADVQCAQSVTSNEDSTLPDDGAPDEMWRAGGDAAVHDAPATSSHKAV